LPLAGFFAQGELGPVGGAITSTASRPASRFSWNNRMVSIRKNWDLESVCPTDDPEFSQQLDQFRGDLQKLAEKSTSCLPPMRSQRQPARGNPSCRVRASGFAGSRFQRVSGMSRGGDAGNKAFRQIEALFSSLDPLRDANRDECGIRSARRRRRSFSDFSRLVRNSSGFRFFSSNVARMPRCVCPGRGLLAADLHVDGLHAWDECTPQSPETCGSR